MAMEYFEEKIVPSLKNKMNSSTAMLCSRGSSSESETKRPFEHKMRLSNHRLNEHVSASLVGGYSGYRPLLLPSPSSSCSSYSTAATAVKEYKETESFGKFSVAFSKVSEENRQLRREVNGMKSKVNYWL